MNIAGTLRETLRGRLEKAYATHYGWDIDVMRGLKLIENNVREPHTIDGPLVKMAALHRPVHRVALARYGRFGNQIIQLKNAAYIAEMCGANIIQRKAPGDLFRPALRDGFIVRHSDRPVAGPDEVVMQGFFYFAEALNIKMQPEDHRRITEKIIRPLLLPGVLVPDERVGPDDMVMHFRAGDIMSGPKIHRKYGQPPVSFYLKAGELSGASRFWLVYEEDSNPAIAAVEAALRNKGMTVFHQSSGLQDDCRVILSARQFAGATGTFAPVLSEISTRLRRFYSFHEFETTPLSAFKTTPVEVTRIEDGDDVYKAACLSRNWSASREQLDLLLSYPVERMVVNREA